MTTQTRTERRTNAGGFPLAAALALACWGLVAELAFAAEKLNVVFLMADDLGWNGPRFQGSDLHETPSLDRLAAEGMKFTDAYAACTVCSPTRAAVLTGQYPARLHLTDWIAGQRRPFAKLKIPDWTKQLEHSRVTLAEALQAKGYSTAHVGKWHLGAQPFYPEHQGFDVNVAGNSSGSPPGGYFLPNKLNLPGAKQGDYLTDRLTDEALEIIERWKDRPFFLYFPYYTVHTPIQGKKELVKRYASKVKPDSKHRNPTYAAMVHSLDESVGRITAKLKELGIARRTVIFFTSDNGGLSQRNGKLTGITDNFPLRRGKGSAYEGGVRVPLVVRWPGVIQPGTVCREPVCSIDYYPTVLQLTGVSGDPKHNRDVDGRSLAPILKDPKSKLDRDAIYWHYPHYHAGGDSPYGAVRAGDWKLIEFYEDMSVELYNLRDDLGEADNLVARMPDKADELRKQLHAWRSSVDAQMPTPNPNYDPQKASSQAKKKPNKK
ncbi:MAG: sulfatase [Planctomycetales bacterium]